MNYIKSNKKPNNNTITIKLDDDTIGSFTLNQDSDDVITIPTIAGPKGDQGLSIEYNWNGTQLGIRLEGEQNYTYVDLKGDDGDSLEFDWDGTRLGVRIVGNANYVYVDLKGDQGEKGEKGDDGKSAYDIAVENGFVGTEQEWLDSLKAKASTDYNINFIDELELEFTAPENIKITGVEYLPDDNSISLTIKVNNTNYTLGTDINYLNTISLTVNAPCFIKLITENI